MERSEFDYLPPRPAWNAGRKVGTKRPLKPRQIWEIRFHLDREHRLRDRALFDLAIDSKLKGCDLVKVRIGDLVTGGELRTRAMVIQQKTNRPVQFEIMSDARGSLFAWLERRGGSIDDYVFPSRVDHSAHMSTRQYARLVDEGVTAVGLRSEDYGTHSLRRTKASIICRRGLVPLRFSALLGIISDVDARLSSPSITAAALAQDFGHLGRFSQQYRALLGELPSQTLARIQRLGEVGHNPRKRLEEGASTQITRQQGAIDWPRCPATLRKAGRVSRASIFGAVQQMG